MARGVCIWLTGLSGSGKTTTGEALARRLEEIGRTVTLLDGDIVRAQLSTDLGFSRADRDTQVRRVGWIASEVVRHGGIAIVALISPYRVARQEARDLVGSIRFVEVFVDTPLDVCAQRDVKGLYARARAGQISGFTAVDDPYEVPERPDIRLETVRSSVAENVERILEVLRVRGLIEPDGAGAGA